MLTLLNWNSAPVESLSVTVRVDHDVAEVTAVNGGTKLKFTTTKDATRAGGFLVAFSLPLEHCDSVCYYCGRCPRRSEGPHVSAGVLDSVVRGLVAQRDREAKGLA